MRTGDLVKYWNLDGDIVFGITTSDVFVHSDDIWTDDGDETIERVATLLDPMEEGIEFA